MHEIREVDNLPDFLGDPVVGACLADIGSIPTVRDEVLGSKEEAENAVIWQNLDPLLRSQFPKIMDIIDSVDPQGKCLHTALASLGLRFLGNSRELQIIPNLENTFKLSYPLYSSLNLKNSSYTYRPDEYAEFIGGDEAEEKFFKTLKRNQEGAITRATGFAHFLSLLGKWLGPDNIISNTIQRAKPLDVVIAPTDTLLFTYPYYFAYTYHKPWRYTNIDSNYIQASYEVIRGDAKLYVYYMPFKYIYPIALKTLHLSARYLDKKTELNWYKENDLGPLRHYGEVNASLRG